MAGLAARRRWFSDWTDWEGLLVACACGICTAAGASYLLGTFGLLSKWPLLVLSLVVGGAAWRLQTDAPKLTIKAPGRQAVVFGLLGIFAALSLWMASILWYVQVGLGDTDPLWYQMPFAVRFFQDKGLTGVNLFDPLVFNHLFPNSSGAIPHAVAMAVFGNDWFSPFVNLGWFAFALLAGTVLGRRVGAGVEGLLVTAIVLTIPEFVYGQAGSGKWDAAVLGLLLTSVAFALAERSSRVTFLVGLVAGLAVSVKLTALLPAFALLVYLVASANRGERLKTGLLLVGGAAVLGSYWFLRALFTWGTPLPTSHIPGFPWSGPALETHLLPSIAKWLLTDPGAVMHQASHRLGSYGDAWFVMLAMAGVGVVAAIVWGRGTQRRTIGVLASFLFVATLFQPASGTGTLNNIVGLSHVRYFAPAMALALIAFGAQLRSMLPAKWSWLPPTLLLGVLVWNVLGTPLLTRGGNVNGPLVALAVIAAMASVWWIATNGTAPARYGVAGLVALIAVVGGHAVATDYAQARNKNYSYYLVTNEPVRIGMMGTTIGFNQYKLFGPKLQNRVNFIGVEGSAGAVRPVRTCAEMVEQVNKGHYDLIYSSRNRESYVNRFSDAPEQAWLAAQPTLRLKKRIHILFTKGWMTVYRQSGPLNMKFCPSNEMSGAGK